MTTTYLSAGPEVFDWANSSKERRSRLHRKRSHGRLKAYASCDDCRAWSNNCEIRKKHILRVVDASRTGYGNYIPVLELVKLLGVPETGLLLNDALKKLNELSRILGHRDMKHPEPSNSERDLRLYCYLTGRECHDEETIRNLRCLVGELYDRTKEMEIMKSERDNFRKRIQDSESHLSMELDQVSSENNCLRLRLKTFEGIEDRLSTLMTKYEKSLKELQEAKQLNARLMQTMSEDKSAEELQRLQIEMRNLCKEANELENENAKLSMECTQLRCSLKDQEDEISRLTNYAEKTAISADCKQEKMRNILNEIQLELNDKVRELETAKQEVLDSSQYIRELTELRDQMRDVIVALTDNKEYFKEAFDLERRRADDLEVASSTTLLEALADPAAVVDCSYLEVVTDMTRETLTNLIRESKEMTLLSSHLKCQLKACQRDLEMKCKELVDKCQELEMYNQENSTLRDQLRAAQEFRKYKDEAESYKRHLQDCCDDKDCLEKTIDKLRREQRDLTDKLMVKEAAIKELTEQARVGKRVLVMKEEIRKLKDKMKSAEDDRRKGMISDVECDKARKELCTLKCELEQCRNHLEEKKSELAKMSLDFENILNLNREGILKVKKVTDLNNILRQAIDDLEKEVIKYKTEITRLKAQLKEGECKVSQSNADRIKAEEQTKRLNEKIAIMEKDMVEIKEAAETAEKEAAAREEELESELQALKDAAHSRPSADECDAKICSMECQLREMQTKLEDAEELLESTRKEKRELEREIARLEEAERLSKLETAKCQDENGRMRMKISELLEEKTNQQDALKDICGTTEECKIFIEKLKSMVLEQQGRINGFQLEVTRYQKKAKELCGKLTVCRDEKESLKADKIKLENDIIEIQKQLEGCKNNVECLKKALTDQRAANMKLKGELKLCQAEVEANKAKMAKLLQENAALESINAGLQKSISGAASSNKKDTMALESLKEENGKLIEEKAALKKQLDEAVAKIQSLSEELASMKAELEDCLRTNLKLNKEVKSLKEENTRLNESNVRFKTELAQCQTARKAAEQQLSGAIIKIQELEDLLEKAKAELTMLREIKGCLMSEVENLRRQQKNDRDEIEGLRNRVGELESQNNTLKGSLEELKNDNLTLKNVKETLLNDLNDRRDTILALESEINRMLICVRQLKNCHLKVENSELVITNLEKSLLNEKNKNETFVSQIVEMRNKFDEALRSCAATERSLIAEKKAKRTLRDQLNTILKKLSKKSKDFENARRKNLSLQSDITNLKNDIAEMQFQMGEKDKSNDKDRIIESMKTEIEMLRKKLDDALKLQMGLQWQVEQSSLEQAGTRNIVERLKVDLSTMLEENSQLKDELGQCRYVQEGMAKRLNEADGIIDNLNKDNNRLEVHIDTLKEENNRLESDNEELKQFTESLEVKIKDLQVDLNRTTNANSILSNKIINQTKQITELGITQRRLEVQLSECNGEVRKLKTASEVVNSKLILATEEKTAIENDLITMEKDKVALKTELNRMSQQLSNCKYALSTMAAEKQSIDVEMRVLKDKYNVLEDKLGEIQMNLTEEQAKVSNLLLERNDLQNNLNRTMNELNEALKDLKVKEEFLHSANEISQSRQEQLEHASRKIYDLEAEIGEWKKSNEIINDERATLKIQLAEMNKKRNKCDEQLSEMETQWEKAKRENKSMSNSLVKITGQLEREAAANASAREEIDSLRGKISALQTDVRVMKSTIGELKEENQTAEKEKELLERAVRTLEDQLQTLNRQIDELNHTARNQSKKILDLEDQNTQIGAKLSVREESLKTVRNEVKKLKADIRTMGQEYSGLEKIKNGLENDMFVLREQMKKAMSDLDQTKAAMIRLTDEKSDLTKELATRIAEFNALNDSMARIKGLLESVQAGKHELEKKVRKMELDKIETNEAMEEERRKNELCNASINNLEQTLKLETSERQAKQMQIASMKDDIKSLQKKLKENEEEISELKEEAESLKTDITEMSSSIKALKSQAPVDTELNRTLQKIISMGWGVCNFSELSEIHEAVLSTTDAMVRSGKVDIAATSKVVAVDPKPKKLDARGMELLQKLAPLQCRLLRSQEQVKKRTCALNEQVSKYQHELNSIRHWDAEITKKMEETTCMTDEELAVLKKQSDLEKSKITHFLSSICQERRQADAEGRDVNASLGRINAIQTAIINDTLPEYASKVTECLRQKLCTANECERKLKCQLTSERQKAAHLEYQICCLRRQVAAPEVRQTTIPGPQFQVEHNAVPVAKLEPAKKVNCNNTSPEEYSAADTYDTAAQENDKEDDIDCPGKMRVSFSEKVETRFFKKDSR